MSGTIYVFQKPTAPLYAKHCLTFEETSYYFDIDLNVVKAIYSDEKENIQLFLQNGKKTLVIRKGFEDYLIDNGYLVYKSGHMIPTCQRNELSRMNCYAPRPEMPWYEKPYFSVEEACEYFNIGRDKMWELVKAEDNATGEDFFGYVLKVGKKTLIRKRKLEEFLEGVYSI